MMQGKIFSTAVKFGSYPDRLAFFEPLLCCAQSMLR